MHAREVVTGGIVLGAMAIAFATVVVHDGRIPLFGGPSAATAGSSVDDLGPGLTSDSTIPPGESWAETPIPHTGCGSY